MILIAILCCLIASIIGAVCGIGGGIIIRPVMDAVSGLPISQISFLSGCTVLSMSATSLLTNKGKIDKERTPWLAFSAAIGGVFGKILLDCIKASIPQEATLGVIQNLLLSLLLVATLVYMLMRSAIRTKQITSRMFNFLIGLLLGVVSSFLGIGGGPFNLAVLSYFLSMDSKTSVLNSLYIVLFSQAANIIYSLALGKVPPLEWGLLIAMTLSGSIGGFLGRLFGHRLSNTHTDRFFYVLLGFIICICLYNIYRYMTS